jgi:hypothetical protein
MKAMISVTVKSLSISQLYISSPVDGADPGYGVNVSRGFLTAQSRWLAELRWRTRG